MAAEIPFLLIGSLRKIDHIARNTSTMCEICQKLIKTPEDVNCHGSGVFIINFEQISHIVRVFSLSTFNK